MREAVPSLLFAVVISGCGRPEAEDLFWTPPPGYVETSASTGGSSEVCEPGRQVACDCPGGAPDGIQRCLPDGTSYGPCEGCGGQGGGGGSSVTSSSSSSGDGGAGAAGSGGAGEGGTGGQVGSGGNGGAEPECTKPTDCPGMDSACAWRTCEAGVCGWELAPAGPLAEQTPGDCRELRCDGAGGEHATPAPSDVPDDGNECTADACASSGPTHEPIATGTECSTGLCQDRACVQHIPVRCQIDEEVYVGCDGDYGSHTIYWTVPPIEVKYCYGDPEDVEYCAPGTGCAVYYMGTEFLGFGECI